MLRIYIVKKTDFCVDVRSKASTRDYCRS